MIQMIQDFRLLKYSNIVFKLGYHWLCLVANVKHCKTQIKSTKPNKLRDKEVVTVFLATPTRHPAIYEMKSPGS